MEQQASKVTGNDVLIEVHAVAVNAIDWRIRSGQLQEMIPFSFPIVFGWDVSGIVKEVGEHVKDFQVGDEIVARADMNKPGGFSEYIVIEEQRLVKKPENITFENAAALPLTSLAAWQMLVDHAKVKEGEKVLIQAGSGGVGSFAIQFAKHFGADVTTTTSSDNFDLVKDLGADTVIDFQEEDFAERDTKYDIVLDTLGGDALDKSYGILKSGGRLVTIAGEPNEALAKENDVTVTYLNTEDNAEQLAAIIQLLSEEKIKVAIAEVFPFNESGIRDAHRLSESGYASGKVVVKVK